MPLNLGDTFPNLEVETTLGKIKYYDYLGESWGVLFSHPADFTPVCTTELGEVANLLPEFQKRNTKVIALSCDPVESHKNWITDIKAYSKCAEFSYPIISDPKREIATQLGMIDPEEKDKAGLPLTCRALTMYKKVATPANWCTGGECMILPTVSKDDAAKLFPGHKVEKVPSGKEYIRITPQP